MSGNDRKNAGTVAGYERKRPGIGLAVLLLLVVSFFMGKGDTAANAAQAGISSHPNVLYISAYAYDWDSVPYQLSGAASVLGSKANMEYLFMNTKKAAYEEVKQYIYTEIQAMIAANGQYDLVVLEDDAALDFALEYRNELFEGVPMVFMGINTAEKAGKAHEDSLITGMIECFPYHETIALAREVFPDATKIVGINDDTESGKGCAQRFFAEEENFPDLEFREINASEMSREELAQAVSGLDDSYILVFLAMVNDGDGNVYSLLEATDFVEENSQIPMFKCDMLGVGEGVLGGYVSSYEEMGKAAGNQALEILNGTSPADIPVDTMGGYPLFDQKMLDKYHISSRKLPEDAVIINQVPSFYEQYRMQVWAGAFLMALILIFFISFIAISKQRANQRLKAEIVRADAATRAKSDFLSRMSHEIRTPMNAIVGLTTIAKAHEKEPERVDEYLGKIETSSKVLLTIINDVLDMSAIESAKLKIAQNEFDIKQVLNGVATIYYSQCKNKGIDFSMAVDLKDELLIGDSLRINQVLMNLVSNAYKFTDRGGRISIRVTETNKKENKVYVRFVVADTGCGMSKEMLSRLFRPFEQETAQTAQKHGGSGLGMSIAKNLVEMMHGAIKVESEPGAGTTFTVDIPFEPASHSGMTDSDELKKMSALIVDDDETARSYTSVVVGRVGIQNDVAATAEQALALMREKQERHERYDMCFIDWKMPGMNGVALTREIREAFDKDTVVIIVSAYDLSEVEEEAKNAGADLFISKPLFQSTVFNTLIQITGGVVKKTEKELENYDFSGRRLLLAEDNALNTEIAMELLGMVHMEVDHAANGQEAVDMFAASKPGYYDLILMDIQMPVKNGYEAARAIRELDSEAAKKIPIYAMTANAFTEDVSHSLSAGMNGHISKPIDTAVLYQTIYKCLDNNK